jgi:hypothetical protein
LAATYDCDSDYELAPRLPKPAAWRSEPMPAPADVDHSHLIARGLPADLKDVPFHGEAPLARWLMAGSGLQPSAHAHIAAHRMDVVTPESRSYAQLHQHAVPEINLILPVTDLTYEVVLGEQRFEVDGPASIFVPAGLPHCANVKSGTGFFVTIVLGVDEYAAFAPSG